MSNIIDTTDLRNKYFSNEIFRIGELVEDTTTGEKMKILDRGSNYVTVATSTGIVKKWLNEVKEETIIVLEESKPQIEIEKDFELLESGQIKLFGYDTKSFDKNLSEFIIEQFSEFDDLYSKHQIIKNLDIALSETDNDKGFSLIEKVESFYNKQNILPPFILESKKNDFERRKITEILASVAGVKLESSNTQTITNIIKEFKDKYKTKQQWDVLNPFLDIAYSYGLTNATQNLPFSSSHIKEDIETDIIFEVFDDNLDYIVDDIEIEDIIESFEDSDFSDDITEGLSITTRAALGRKLKHREPILVIKRERAMVKSASSEVLLSRARKLAETMLKRRMFKKSPADMSRQEKERFEAGAFKRKALVARLAQRLMSKVRMLQSTRLHHQQAPSAQLNTAATTAGSS